MIPRTALHDLEQWKNRPNRKPLIIRGARQVGKSYLVKLFAQKNFENYIEINFEKDPTVGDYFLNESIDKILALLQAHTNKKIVPNKTLLFFDEIQACPHVFAKLRYFYEEKPEIPIIAAGSLLEFLFTSHEFSVPVGRIEYLHLGPLTFEEFLKAQNEDALLDFIGTYTLQQTIPQPLHNKLMDKVRQFTLVGGMPEVVAHFIQYNDYQEVDRIKSNLIETYEEDFSKYKKKVDVGRLAKVYRKVPSLVCKKLKYVHIDPNERAKDLSDAIHLLSMAKIIYKVHHSASNGIPLGADINEKFFKLLYLDVGLLTAATGLSLVDIEHAGELNLINQGAISEQWIGQHLLYAEPNYQAPQLYYWIREKKGAAAEIDYVIPQGPHIIPVEVKSGKTGRLKSLSVFAGEKKTKTALRFNSDIPSVIDNGLFKLVSLPFYLVGQWARLIA
ncbi:AAA family ATPase [bacterium]|nr:AAA family ATPase [bacterium]